MRLWRWAAGALLGLALAACGGGGGGPATSIAANESRIDLVVPDDGPMPSAEVVISYKGAGLAVGTPSGESIPSWLEIETPQSAASPVHVVLRAGSNANMQSQGVYPTTLRFATANADLSDIVYTDVVVTLVIPHRVSPSQITFRTTEGQPAPVSDKSVDLVASGVDWTATPSQPWLKVDRASGSGSATLQAGIDLAAVTAGVYSAQLTVGDAAHGVDRAVDVRLIVDPRQLVVRRHGVAFTSIGTYQQLSGTIETVDNAGRASQWSAHSDQSWLHLSAATGSAGQALTVTADPAGLADGIHYAHVTLTPTTAGVAGGGTVTVGLYVDTQHAAQASFYRVPRQVQPPVYGYAQLLADPVRPYVYLSQSDYRIDVYNIYTGQLVGHVTKTGTGLSSMAIAPDGSVLLVADLAGRYLRRIDPDTLTMSAPLGQIRIPERPDFRMAAQFVGGKLLLATTAGQLIDVSQAKVVKDFSAAVPINGSGQIAFSNDGRSLAIQQSGYSPHDLYRLEVYASGSGFEVAVGEKLQETESAQSVSFSAEDSAIVTGTGSGGYFYSSADMSVVSPLERMRGVATPLLDGRFYSGNTDWQSINVYDASGILTDVLDHLGQPYGLCVSGDQRRLMVFTGDISFRDAP